MDSLKKLIKEDIWKIIYDEEVPNRDFFTYVLSLLLNNKKILLKDVVELSKELKNRYMQILSEVNNYIEQGNGEVLPVLRRLNDDFTANVLPILKQIERYKKNN